MRKLIFIPMMALSLPLFSANQCISGKLAATNLIDQMKSAKENSPITKIIYSQYNIGNQNTEAKVAKYECLACTAEEQQRRANNLAQIAASSDMVKPAPHLLFRSECLDRKSTRLNSSHGMSSRMPSSA